MTTPESHKTGGPLKVLDLFSGIGGFALGLERAGMETVAFCEISPKCRHLLATHWPHVRQFDDVTTLTGEQVGPVDVICGGFPCQDISFAGKGAGLAGERSGLWRHYARLIGELRPDFVIVENVAALLGRGLGDVLGDLAALGYDAWWDCIPAAAVGAPHRRDRLWVVAYARGQQHEGYGDALRREIAEGLSEANLADAPRELRNGRGPGSEQDGGAEPSNGCPPMADAQGERCAEARAVRHSQPEERSAGSSEAVAVSGFIDGQGLIPSGVDAQVGKEPRERSPRSRGHGLGWWSAEPDVGRVAHGVPARVDRLHGLGNAVVPQIPEILGRAILSAMSLSHPQRSAA